jgi:hypothetical protein
MLETMLETKTLIKNSLDDWHDVRKNKLDDSIEYFVLFENRARDDFDDYLINFVLDNLEKIDEIRVFNFDDVVEICHDEWEEEEIY